MFPLLLAHRTGMANAPENSLMGFRQCARDGIDGLECDISFTRDGEPFIWDIASIHLQDTKKSLSEINFCETRRIRRQDCNEGLMHINDIWHFIESHPRIKIFFDIKYYTWHTAGHFQRISRNLIKLTVEKIVKPAVKMGLDGRMGFVTFEGGMDLLVSVKKLCPKISTSLMLVLPRPWLELQDSWRGRVDSITLGWSRFNPWRYCHGSLETIRLYASEAGVPVYGGLANSEDDIKWLLKNNFDGIWSDNVLKTKQFIAEYIKTKSPR